MTYIIDNSTFFKAVNMVASKMEGHRSAKMKLAYAIVSECRMTEVNTLFNREQMTSLVKLVVASGITIESAEQYKESKLDKSNTQKLNKVSTKSKSTRAKATKNVEQADKIVHTGLPATLEEYFTPEQCDTVEELLQRYVSYANKNEGKHMDAQRHNYIDGMNALSKVQDTEGLQAVMVAYFMRDYATKMIAKMLEMGVGYKKLNSQKSMANIETKQSYMQASSNRGNIVAFDNDDILNDLIVDAYRLSFGEQMFDSVSNAMASLYWRMSNVIQVRSRELRNQTKVVAAKKQYTKEEADTMSTTQEEALQMAIEMGVFTDAEMEIIKLRIAGLKKKEIDKQLGKRTDRTFDKMKQAYSTAV